MEAAPILASVPSLWSCCGGEARDSLKVSHCGHSYFEQAYCGSYLLKSKNRKVVAEENEEASIFDGLGSEASLQNQS